MAVVKGAGKLAQRLRTLRSNLGDVVSEQEIAPFLLRRIKRRYEAGIDSDLRPFKPLSPKTIAKKKRKASILARKPESILFETGKLFASLRVVERTGSFASPTGAGFSIGINPTDARSQRLARIHQFGLQGTPQRKFLGVTRLDVKAVDSLIRRRFNLQVQKANQ
jgi:hypothetical protein